MIKAINERERLKLTRSDWIDYEVNRMICNININLGKHEGFNDIEKDFEWVKQYPDKKDDWLNSVQKELADKLRERLN